jgi:hypothetical protein
VISVIGAVDQAIAGRFEPTIPVSLFYREDGWSVGEISLDLILTEGHSLNAAVTQHPVQDGSTISDHITILPRNGTLRALVSNFSLAAASSNKAETWQDVYEQGEAAQESLPNRAADTWEKLKELVKRRELVKVVTALEVYEDMALTRVETTRDGDTGDALEIEIDYEQAVRVKLKETKVTAQVQPRDMKSTINQKSAVQVNSGQKVGLEATPQEETQLTFGEVAL